MSLIFFGTTAFFVCGACVLMWHLKWMRRLPSLEQLGQVDKSSKGEPARCSIVVAARDEESRIGETVRRLLAQGGVEVEVEVIVVNDRSRDRTGEILQSWAKADSRLRVVNIEHLPDGWLGKCHACHVGARAARGEWILFTDADCWSKPDLLCRALRVAAREQADHVTLTAGTAVAGPGLHAGSVLFHLSLANWISGVNRDLPNSYLGIGAFNLVRAEAYRQCGGYEALRLTVLDDVRLGLLLRRAGKRTRAFLGGDDVEAHWGTWLWNVVGIMEKNYFAALEFRTLPALGLIAFLGALVGVVVLGAVWGTVAGWGAALSPFCLAIPGAIVARRMGWSGWVSLGVPFAIPVFLCALVNSTYRTLSNGGVRWRETFYSIKTLRAGEVR
ncbi:MAG: glycosyltransferase family 2 protein [Verrucomicrobiales bacterium]|nr:glycosyltransferase family 2 protein [Verrucomicrobiales bacterium]